MISPRWIWSSSMPLTLNLTFSPARAYGNLSSFALKIYLMVKYSRFGNKVTVWPSKAILPDSIFPYKKNGPTSLNLSTTGILSGPSGFLSGNGTLFKISISVGPLYQLHSGYCDGWWMFLLVRESIGINSTLLKPQEDFRNGSTWSFICLYLSSDH